MQDERPVFSMFFSTPESRGTRATQGQHLPLLLYILCLYCVRETEHFRSRRASRSAHRLTSRNEISQTLRSAAALKAAASPRSPSAPEVPAPSHFVARAPSCWRLSWTDAQSQATCAAKERQRDWGTPLERATSDSVARAGWLRGWTSSERPDTTELWWRAARLRAACPPVRRARARTARVGTG